MWFKGLVGCDMPAGGAALDERSVHHCILSISSGLTG
jgi:hypothetical protein